MNDFASDDSEYLDIPSLLDYDSLDEQSMHKDAEPDHIMPEAHVSDDEQIDLPMALASPDEHVSKATFTKRSRESISHARAARSLKVAKNQFRNEKQNSSTTRTALECIVAALPCAKQIVGKGITSQ